MGIFDKWRKNKQWKTSAELYEMQHDVLAKRPDFLYERDGLMVFKNGIAITVPVSTKYVDTYMENSTQYRDFPKEVKVILAPQSDNTHWNLRVAKVEDGKITNKTTKDCGSNGWDCGVRTMETIATAVSYKPEQVKAIKVEEKPKTQPVEKLKEYNEFEQQLLKSGIAKNAIQAKQILSQSMKLEMKMQK